MANYTVAGDFQSILQEIFSRFDEAESKAQHSPERPALPERANRVSILHDLVIKRTAQEFQPINVYSDSFLEYLRKSLVGWSRNPEGESETAGGFLPLINDSETGPELHQVENTSYEFSFLRFLPDAERVHPVWLSPWTRSFFERYQETLARLSLYPTTDRREQPLCGSAIMTLIQTGYPEEAFERRIIIHPYNSAFSGQATNTSTPSHPAQPLDNPATIASIQLFGQTALATAANICAVGKDISALSNNAKVLKSAAAASTAVGFLACLAVVSLARHRSFRVLVNAMLRVGCFASASGFLALLAVLLPDQLNLWAAGFACLACFLIAAFPAFVK